MISLGKLFKKNTSWLRSLKLVYIVNNFLNKSQLSHNKALYKKYNLNQSILWPIGSHVFQKNKDLKPWLDQPNALENLHTHPDFNQFSKSIQAELVRFVEEGYMILKGFFTEDEVDQHNAEIDQLLSSNKVDFNYTGRKIMEAYKHAPYIEEYFFKRQELLALLNFIMGKKVIPFHTINFLQGSEQAIHSDSIHMTTYPEGYLIAAWTALEEVSPENGTLIFYPGSHKLPYVTCQDYPSGNTKWRIGNNSNKKYEHAIVDLIAEHQLEPKLFYGKKGDVFIWHANLLHGGSPIKKPGSTRKSMVAHYFTEEVICYHEISQRPALMPS